MEIQRHIKEFLALNKTIGLVIVVMVGGAILQLLLYLIFADETNNDVVYHGIMQKFLLPTEFSRILTQPWSLLTFPIFTYPFAIFSFLINAWLFYTFGRIFQQIIGEYETRRLTVLSLIAIGIGSAVAYLLLPMKGAVYGGIGALLASLVVASITLVPNYTINLMLFGPVQLVWVGVVVVILELAQVGFTRLCLPILVGAGFGYAYVQLLRGDSDILDRVWNLFNKRSKEPKPKIKVAYNAQKQQSYKKTESFTPNTQKEISPTEEEQVPQEVIDAILDKISEKGYDKLSRQEKEILYKASRKSDKREV